MHHASRTSRAPARRGMTFLEVVFASVLLALVAGSMFAAFAFIFTSQAREQARLGAFEVANRLILSYLDDSTKMPDSNKTLDYGPPEALQRFRWQYKEEPLTLYEVAGENRDQSRQSPLSNDRFKRVTVRVWLSEYSGGSPNFEGTSVQATVTRMLDPIAPRNPDSYMNMIQSPEGLQKLVEQLMGTNQSGNVVTRGGLPGAGQNRQGIRPGEAFNRGGQGGPPGGRQGGQFNQIGGGPRGGPGLNQGGVRPGLGLPGSATGTQPGRQGGNGRQGGSGR
ncbi:MAG: type II secretion system protein [Phycisphaerales bacterium]